MRAFRLLSRASLLVSQWPASQPRLSALNKTYTRRHAFFSKSVRRIPGQARAFSSTRPTQFMLDGDSTIYALSTAPGRAAIAVVRISGPACVPVCDPNHRKPPNTNKTRYTKASVQTHPSPSPAMQPFAHSTTQPSPELQTQSSTPAP
jgi:tRNA modification GTPase